MPNPKYSVYEADRAGDCNTICQTNDAVEALKVIQYRRSLRPQNVFGIYLTDDPEKGDVEFETEPCIEQPCPYMGYTDTKKCWAHSQGLKPAPRPTSVKEVGPMSFEEAKALDGK